MPSSRHHNEWLSLIEVSGPFLSAPVLERVFPHGLDAHDPEQSRLLELAFDEWEDDQQGDRPNPAIHREWVNFVLEQTLGLPDEVLVEGKSIPQMLRATPRAWRDPPAGPRHQEPRGPARCGKSQTPDPELPADARPRKATLLAHHHLGSTECPYAEDVTQHSTAQGRRQAQPGNPSARISPVPQRGSTTESAPSSQGALGDPGLGCV